MRTYDLLLILPATTDITDEKTIAARLEKLFTGQTIASKTMVIQGKKTLAYEIDHATEGVYVQVTIKAEAFNLGLFEKQAKLTTDLLRYLLTRKLEGK